MVSAGGDHQSHVPSQERETFQNYSGYPSNIFLNHPWAAGGNARGRMRKRRIEERLSIPKG